MHFSPFYPMPINAPTDEKYQHSSSYHKRFHELLELVGGVDLVGQDCGDGLVNLVHQLHELGGPALVDLLDKGVVLLPERHLEATIAHVVV